VQLISSLSSEYGNLVLSSDGKGGYTYTISENSPSIINLKTGEVVTDVFQYRYFADNGESSTAKLTVSIIGNQVDANGDPIFGEPDDTIYDNVDVEFNNRSADATPLNSNRNIKGHLYDSEDKDWFYLTSAGNEIITLEVCPAGTSCFGKKSWVLYVFDPDLLTLEMEERTFQFSRWVDETGTDKDLLENIIISTNAGTSNHMYLAYNLDYFEGALIGVVDPCFDTLNTVEIGVPEGPKDYLIAISSPLKGDADTGASNSCGQGSVILERPGLSASGLDAEGKAKTYETTEEFITAFPYSDDQYAIKITGTGLPPLNSEQAIASSSFFDPATSQVSIPIVRVNDQVYQATLSPTPSARSTDNAFKFILTAFDSLNVEEVINTYRATYNFENQQVMIPRVTDISTGRGYSVILQLQTSDDGASIWFEVINIVRIQ